MPTADAPDPLGPGASPVRTMVADGRTGGRLVWSLARFVARRPATWKTYGYLALGALVGVTIGGLGSDPGQDVDPYPVLLLVIGILGAAQLVLDVVRLRRSGRSAPAGATLSWTTSGRGFRFEHATASHVLPWGRVFDALVVGRSVLLVVDRSVLPLPRELVGDDLDRVLQRARVAPRAGAPREGDRPPTDFVPGSRLPHLMRCTSRTGRDQYREFLRRRPRGRLVALTALALAAAVALAVLRPSTTATVLAACLGARAAQWLWSGRAARAHFDHSFPDGHWFAAGVVGEDLVTENPWGRLSLYLRGLGDVRESPYGLLVRSVSGETVTLPHGLLPPDVVVRLRSAARRPRAR